MMTLKELIIQNGCKKINYPLLYKTDLEERLNNSIEVPFTINKKYVIKEISFEIDEKIYATIRYSVRFDWASMIRSNDITGTSIINNSDANRILNGGINYVIKKNDFSKKLNLFF